MKKNDIAMRDAFFDALFEIAQEDKRVVMITADCGAPSLDKFGEKLKGRYFTVGIAEQNMISVAAGLALDGKIVYVYAIAPFASLRCIEQIKVDLCCMNLPVTVLGIGAGWAYDIMGPTHHSTEDISMMRSLPRMTIFNPSDSAMAAALAPVSYGLAGPKYIRIDRGGAPSLYRAADLDLSKGMVSLGSGADLCIIATGIMVHRALEIAEGLSGCSIKASVIDLFRIKPLNEELLLGSVAEFSHIVTLEEHLIAGGLGSAVLELLSDRNVTDARLKRFGICDRYYFEYGGRGRLHELSGLTAQALTRNIKEWYEGRAKNLAGPYYWNSGLRGKLPGGIHSAELS